MDFNEYQRLTRETDSSNSCTQPNFLYYALGMCGETGEVAEKLKKLMRDKNGIITEEFKQELKKELGDVQWYNARIADIFGIEFDDVAKTNIEKLFSRKERNKLKGEGDNR